MPGPPSAGDEVAAVHAAGAREHPDVALEARAFVEHVEHMATRQAAALVSAQAHERRAWLLAHGQPGELFLAAGCERSVGGAWARFGACFLPWLGGVLERRGARPAEVEALVGETPGLMLLPPRSGAARTTLGTWDGRARLTSWLAAITLRRWVAERARSQSSSAVVERLQDDRRFSRRAAAPEPLEAALGGEAAAALLAALDEAWDALTPRERLALLLRYRGGCPQTRIAQLLGVGEPRVSRLLASAVERLRCAAEGRLDPELARRPELAAALARWLATREGPDAPTFMPAPAKEATGGP